MKLYIWTSAAFDKATLLIAKDEQEAKERIIKDRIKYGSTRLEALGWFDEHDQLHEADADLMNWRVDITKNPTEMWITVRCNRDQ